ncbi:HEAT repeat domain-containing protein [Paenibacillus nasutitermitis]|uniref:Esterase n=1 Tax=Paenibacillus nasutitermitis TaxID=1652958 RepID=A0A916YQ38_9BACL|nr:HEAT repeat domain-containing protein [Paenibacillus nasutitermitis]GGD53984.1 hypothetical protein GCM10010911_09380 [Paenibacillus nasutitermitis]
MNETEATNELPPNYEELKKAANRTSSWKERLEAVEELGQYNHPKTIDVLTHRMMHDTVFSVQEAAFRKLQAFGEDVQAPARPKGELIKGVGKVLVRVKKSLPQGHSYEEFKEKLKKTRLDIYDTYEGDKGDEFDAWLEQTWASLTRR